jgi:hypothetical protein
MQNKLFQVFLGAIIFIIIIYLIHFFMGILKPTSTTIAKKILVGGKNWR